MPRRRNRAGIRWRSLPYREGGRTSPRRRRRRRPPLRIWKIFGPAIARVRKKNGPGAASIGREGKLAGSGPGSDLPAVDDRRSIAGGLFGLLWRSHRTGGGWWRGRPAAAEFVGAQTRAGRRRKLAWWTRAFRRDDRGGLAQARAPCPCPAWAAKEELPRSWTAVAVKCRPPQVSWSTGKAAGEPPCVVNFIRRAMDEEHEARLVPPSSSRCYPSTLKFIAAARRPTGEVP